MTTAAIEAALLAPGSPFELADEPVLGETLRVFRTRAPSLRTFLERSAAFGDRPYLVFGDRRLGFREHLARVASTAAALRDRYGVGPGDRVAILGANSADWIVAFWATVSLGAIAVAMNGWWTGDEIAYALADSEPKVLIGDDKRLARMRGEPGIPVLSMERDAERLATHDRGAALSSVPIAEDDAAIVLYTSGTTGRPKGAVLTHRNAVALVAVQSFHGARLMRLAGAPPGFVPPPPVLLSANPLFHVSGLTSGAIAHLAIGATSVWLFGKFEPGVALETIARERVTGWAPHGSMAYRVIHHPDRARFDVSSVRSLGSGGAPVTREIQEGLRQAFPNAHAGMGVGYGLTEATGLATLAFGDELAAHPTSVGRPLATVDVSIRDADGRALDEGDEGEIAIRGPLVMREYWRRPEETAASIGPGRWLRTGDVGRLEGGRLFIAARRRDLILRGAENVYPAEIEARLSAHPEVAEVAVLGVDSVELGQEVKAIVVPRPGHALDSTELARWVGETLAYYKVPAHWEVRGEPLPRNATGKVMKYVLAGEGENPYEGE